jgi:hypothetical protein
MHRLIRPATGLCVALALVATICCNRQQKSTAPQDATIEEQSDELLTSVSAANPKAGPQLLNGFYGVEGNAWRWTAKQFAVLLPTPDASAAGFRLVLKVTVPQTVIEKQKSVTLQARVGDVMLDPQTFSTSGSGEYSRDVPAQALKTAGDTFRVDFSLDKSLPPANGDKRELGIVFNSLVLEPK